MGETTKIEWCDATFSPWEGCTETGPGCDHCYAREMNKRWRGGKNWGAGAPRRMTDWNNAFALERKAVREERQIRVFPSICDPFDGEVDDAIRADYFALIRATPHLTHLLLTKRPANAKRWYAIRPDLAELPNVHMGVTVCNQEEADRFRAIFAAIPVRVKFVSYEPALGLVDWSGWEFVQQIIYGGESGHGSRPADVAWARAMVAWCAAKGVAAFVKQLGAQPIIDVRDYRTISGWRKRPLTDSKGGDMAEWPEDLRVRQFPAVTIPAEVANA